MRNEIRPVDKPVDALNPINVRCPVCDASVNEQCIGLNNHRDMYAKLIPEYPNTYAGVHIERVRRCNMVNRKRGVQFRWYALDRKGARRKP